MRAVLTRVKSASVSIDGQVVGKIGKGFLILLGVGPNDTEKETCHCEPARRLVWQSPTERRLCRWIGDSHASVRTGSE